MNLSSEQPVGRASNKLRRKILIVEDDIAMVRAVLVSLRARGYEPCVVQMATRVLAVVSERKPDAVLLDLGLPDASGLGILRPLRKWSDVLVLIVLARHDEMGEISALDEGADDYVTKPSSMRKLLARLHSIMWRASKVMVEEVPKVASADDHLMIDLVKRQVLVADELVHPIPREWDILVYLVQHCGELMTKLELLKAIWDDRYEKETNYLRVYVSQLHHRIGPRRAHNKYLRTEMGIGYRMALGGE